MEEKPVASCVYVPPKLEISLLEDMIVERKLDSDKLKVANERIALLKAGRCPI